MKLPKLTLTVVAGPTQGQKYSSELPFLVGRTRASNKCTIKDPEVSSKHIELRAEQGKWVLCELGSSNGTYLNQDAVEQPDDNEDRGPGYSLKSGDVLRLGTQTRVEVTIEGENIIEDSTLADVSEADTLTCTAKALSPLDNKQNIITVEQKLMSEVEQMAEDLKKRTETLCQQMIEESENCKEQLQSA